MKFFRVFLIAACLEFFFQLSICKKGKGISCVDKFVECGEHADDCTVHPGFMVINCPKTCHMCHLQDPKVRCSPSFLNISTMPVLQAGQMDEIFKRIRETHSDVKILSDSPVILEFEDFLTDRNIDDLLKQVTKWDQSSESGEIDPKTGVGAKLATTTRTSSTFWCNNDCQTTPISTLIREKIGSILQIPAYHFEPIQLLKYNVGESFVPHHDFSYDELTLPCGPRVLTFFLYLSDVEEGGETSFPDLQLTIKPKKGKAVLWPNTLSENPMRKDTRMTHEAKPVKAGVKYAANVWVHLLEWDRPSLWSCTGS
jgi:cytochrome c551/c552